VKIPLEGGKPVGELKTPVLGELNPPKNRRIPWMNQEIVNGETWRALTVVLEKRRVKRVKGQERGGFYSDI
jgi:hypothetical protein